MLRQLLLKAGGVSPKLRQLLSEAGGVRLVEARVKQGLQNHVYMT